MIDGDDDKNKNSLMNFIAGLNNRDLPDGWQKSPIARRSYQEGHNDGYRVAALQYEKTLDAIRHILDLDAQRDSLDEI